MWKSTKGRPLPEAGEVFLAPLGKGLYSFCWVVGHAEVLNGGDFISFAFASWVGRRPPTSEEIEAREVLVLTSPEAGAFKGKGHVRKLSEAPPRAWKRLGKVADPLRGVPPPVAYGGFDSLGWEVLREWQWRNDRGQMARDDQAEREKFEHASQAEDARAEALRERRKNATLAQLARSKTILFEWDGLCGKRDREAVEKILRSAASALAKLPAAKPAVKRKALEAAFEAINAWNDRRSVIDTPEREALIDALDDIAHAAGLRGRDIGKAWRDW